MKKLLILTLLLLVFPVRAAVPITGAIRYNSDVTGTNTQSGAVTVTLRTNLHAGQVIATNGVNVGTGTGRAGTIDISSTNGTYMLTFTVATNGTLQLNFGTTNLLTVALPSGYTGAGSLFLSDDGTYKSASAASSSTITNDLTVYGNAYLSNLYALYGYITNNLTVYGNGYFSNLYTLNGFVTNNFSVYGNGYFSNLYALNAYVTNQLQVLGSLYASNFFFTNIQGTIDPTATGLTLKQRRSLKLQYPRRIDGSGCTYGSTNDITATNFMLATFSGTAATNANWAEYGFRVPADLDTSVDLTASLSTQQNGTSTSDVSWTVGMVSTANGSAVPGTAANYVAITITPASSTAGAVTASNSNTLTDWRSNMTANQWCTLRLSRVGGDANNDTQSLLELELFYTSTQ